MTAEENYWAIHDEIKALHRKKGADYGQADDPLANIRAAEHFGIPAWVAAALRMNDKMIRIQAFVRNGRLENESIEDSLLDVANYAMLGLALYREEIQAKADKVSVASTVEETEPQPPRFIHQYGRWIENPAWLQNRAETTRP